MNLKPSNKILTNEAAIIQAKEFMINYYNDVKNHSVAYKNYEERRKEVVDSIRYDSFCSFNIFKVNL